MKKVIIITILFILSFCYGIANETPATVRNVVVRVYGEAFIDHFLFQDPVLQWTGSAFGVGEENETPVYFVTNRHVVEVTREEIKEATGLNWSNGYSVELYIVYQDIEHAISAELVAVSEDADLALLKAKQPIGGRRTAKILGENPEELVGQSVSALGFPAAADEFLSEENKSKLFSNISQVTLTKGVISRVLDASQTGGLGQLIQHNAPINGGNSGGPLVSENGYVVGVNTYGISGANGVFSSVSNQQLIRFLDQNGVKYQKVTENSPVKSYRIGLIVAGIGVVAATIIVLCIKNNGKTSKQIISNNPEQIAERQEEAISKKPLRCRIECSTGFFAGRSFAVIDRLTFGRDEARCTVSFPHDTLGVSGFHCTIKWDGSKALIRDEHSSYGTYVNHHRIPPDTMIEIKDGSLIGLGSDQYQLFLLRID